MSQSDMESDAQALVSAEVAPMKPVSTAAVKTDRTVRKAFLFLTLFIFVGIVTGAAVCIIGLPAKDVTVTVINNPSGDVMIKGPAVAEFLTQTIDTADTILPRQDLHVTADNDDDLSVDVHVESVSQSLADDIEDTVQLDFSTTPYVLQGVNYTHGVCSIATSSCTFTNSTNARRRLGFWFTVIRILLTWGATELGDGTRPPPAPAPEGSSSCFPARATVPTPSGPTFISEIGVGDTMITPCGAEEVYLQTHHDSETEFVYVNIVTDTNHKLQLSPDHFTTTDGQDRLAANVRVGQSIKVHGVSGPQLATVVNVHNSIEKGAFNPMVPCGKVWVNNVTASDVSTTRMSFEELVAEKDLPTFYHRLFYPLRVIYALHPDALKKFCESFRGSAAISDFPVSTIVERAAAAWMGN